MAIKTFTTEVLTSADTNTYLTNSGLVYITNATISAASSTTSVSNCFSASFDNYRIIFTATIATDTVRFRLNYRNSGGDVTTANYNNGAGGGFGASWAIFYSQAVGQTSSFLGDAATSSRFQCVLDICNPFAAEHTTATYNSTATLDPTVPDILIGVASFAATTSMTGFTIQRNSGTGTFGGKIFVYGYRQA